jgi:tripartite-type tricarboxylate transporter receptor subunit TctC
MAQGESTFPERPLTLLVGFNPGGSTDIQAQALAAVLEDELAQPVEVLHQPGAGGGVAAAMLASSPEQGYVIMFGTSLPFTFTPLVSDTSYDFNSFRYIGALALDQSAIVTGGQQPYQSWQAFLTYARNQGEIPVASQTPQDRFIINLISRREQLPFRVIPTTGGSGMAPLVLSGDVAFSFSGGTHTQYTDNGDMRVLISLVDERLAAYPEAPTLRELGYDISLQNPRVAVVPANTPDEQVARLSVALEAATRDPRYIAATERVRLPIVFYNEIELASLFNRQLAEYRWLVQEYGD